MKVIGALGALGITGQRAQLSFQGASIWADLAPGAPLFVNAWPTGTDRGDFTVIDDRQLEGVPVQVVRYTGSPVVRHRFACTGDTYEVPWEIDAFVARFIRALGCAR